MDSVSFTFYSCTFLPPPLAELHPLPTGPSWQPLPWPLGSSPCSPSLFPTQRPCEHLSQIRVLPDSEPSPACTSLQKESGQCLTLASALGAQCQGGDRCGCGEVWNASESQSQHLGVESGCWGQHQCRGLGSGSESARLEGVRVLASVWGGVLVQRSACEGRSEFRGLVCKIGSVLKSQPPAPRPSLTMESPM